MPPLGGLTMSSLTLPLEEPTMTITASSSQQSAVNVLAASRNGLLDQLPPDDFVLLKQHLVDGAINVGDVLHECGEPIKRVYFPTSGLVSLMATVPEGHAIDTAMIGCDGGVGLVAGIGCQTTWSRAVVHLPGNALHMSAAQFAEIADRNRPLRAMIARHQDMLMAQVQQTVVCNTVHPIQARLCRWLLQARDRTGTDNLAVTQEFLSGILGVQRTTITLVSRILQSEGILHVRRGHIHIRDVAALERKACDCYRTTRALTEQMADLTTAGIGDETLAAPPSMRIERM
jgi:CRP-like cAMP-binding protein